jgi:hypothetical protein
VALVRVNGAAGFPVDRACENELCPTPSPQITTIRRAAKRCVAFFGSWTPRGPFPFRSVAGLLFYRLPLTPMLVRWSKVFLQFLLGRINCDSSHVRRGGACQVVVQSYSRVWISTSSW